MKAPLRLAAALLLALAAPLQAEESWRAVQWGMEAEALAAAVPGLKPAALDYGPLTGAFVLPQAEIADLTFRAILQTGADGGLRQILFERRRPELRPGDAPRALAALRAAHGPEDQLCLFPPLGGGPARAEAVWRLPDGVLHLSWVDFGTGEALGDIDRAEWLHLLREGEVDAARDLQREMPYPSALRAALPRRLLIRWRDPQAPGLAGDCPPVPPQRITPPPSPASESRR